MKCNHKCSGAGINQLWNRGKFKQETTEAERLDLFLKLIIRVLYLFSCVEFVDNFIKVPEIIVVES